jgi:hypothetical protein
MEVLRSSDFFGLGPGGSLTSDTTGFFDLSNPGFTVRWEITANGPPATMKTLSVRAIAARDPMGVQKEVTLTSVRAR